jgi:methionyl aminopeptidase
VSLVSQKSRREIATMRRAGRVVAEVLELVREASRPGVSTAALDRIAADHIRRSGASPSFLGYPGPEHPRPFPATICISIDDEVVHGIPGERQLREGQVVSIDAGAIVDGWHGDAARTFYIGDPPAAIADLIDATHRSLEAGIAAAMPGAYVDDISGAVEAVAEAGGYGIVRQYVGHGIGTSMHEAPQVPNYRSRGGSRGHRLAPGICLAIEPMLTLGRHEVETRPDGWTVVTRDGSLAAHFEDTIAVTEDGPEILTRLE